MIKYFHSSESVDKFMCPDKIEFIDDSLLLKDASVKIIDIKLPVVRAFESVDFQRRMFGILFEKGYLFLKFLFYVFGKFVILGQELGFYGDEIMTQSLFPSSLTNSSIRYFFPFPAMKFFSAFLTFSCTFSVQNQA